MINKDFVISQLKEIGYEVESISYNGSGSNHHVYEVTTDNGKELIVKFTKVRHTEKGIQEENTDTMFGGKLSLKRESYLFDLIGSANLPTPKTYYINDKIEPNYIVISKCPGKDFIKWMEENNYSKTKYLNSMKKLGIDFSNLHQLSFKSFGNIMVNSIIEPENINNFSTRYKSVNDMILSRCITKKVFNEKEHNLVETFFNNKFDYFRARLDAKTNSPTLAITDIHGGNFFVDNEGTPSGYFDVESAQAAPKEFELYSFPFFIFNFFDTENIEEEAKQAFLEGYTGEIDWELIDFFSACRLLELVQSYWGYIDGLRDNWGQKLKEVLLEFILRGSLDYTKIGTLWRERDKQPKSPNLK